MNSESAENAAIDFPSNQFTSIYVLEFLIEHSCKVEDAKDGEAKPWK